MSGQRKSKGSQTLGSAIRDLLNTYHIEGRFDETNLLASWERLVGKPIAKRTSKLFIRSQILYVAFDSSTIAHDFQLHKMEILTLFQKEFGSQAIKDIIII